MFGGVFFLLSWITAQNLMRFKIIPEQLQYLITGNFFRGQYQQQSISGFCAVSPAELKKKEFLAERCAPTFNPHT